MTIKMNLQNVKDRVKDDSLDLSLCELVQVPVKEIASIRKVTNLDLSNNLLVTLPKNFTALTQLVKLDLSKNMLTEIPEDIGELKRLKHLDLYANQISRLPLSMGDLKSLKWLDLKENPLTPAVASVAGPCSDTKECQDCARKVVAYLSNVKEAIEQEKLRRLKQFAENEKEKEKEPPTKKESKKKKKKNIEKESKMNKDANGCKLEGEDLHNKENHSELVKMVSESSRQQHMSNDNAKKGNNTGSNVCWKMLKWCVILPMFFIFSCAVLFAALPNIDKQLSDSFIGYVKDKSHIDLKPYQEYCANILHHVTDLAIVWYKRVYKLIDDVVDKYAAGDDDNIKNEF